MLKTVRAALTFRDEPPTLTWDLDLVAANGHFELGGPELTAKVDCLLQLLNGATPLTLQNPSGL